MQTKEDVQDSCCVCGEVSELPLPPGQMDSLLTCTGCKINVHKECYGLLERNPPETWFCDLCAANGNKADAKTVCMFCPCKGGAMKPTENGKWGHILCAFWLVELGFRNPQTMDVIHNVDGIDKNRRKWVCKLCNVKEGYCTQCIHPHCRFSFHPVCAFNHHLRMEFEGYDPVDEEDSGVAKIVFCPTHVDSVFDKQAHIRKLTLLHKKWRSKMQTPKTKAPKATSAKRKRSTSSLAEAEDEHGTDEDEDDMPLLARKKAWSAKKSRVSKDVASSDVSVPIQVVTPPTKDTHDTGTFHQCSVVPAVSSLSLPPGSTTSPALVPPRKVQQKTHLPPILSTSTASRASDMLKPNEQATLSVSRSANTSSRAKQPSNALASLRARSPPVIDSKPTQAAVKRLPRALLSLLDRFQDQTSVSGSKSEPTPPQSERPTVATPSLDKPASAASRAFQKSIVVTDSREMRDVSRTLPNTHKTDSTLEKKKLHNGVPDVSEPSTPSRGRALRFLQSISPPVVTLPSAESSSRHIIPKKVQEQQSSARPKVPVKSDGHSGAAPNSSRALPTKPIVHSSSLSSSTTRSNINVPNVVERPPNASISGRPYRPLDSPTLGLHYANRRRPWRKSFVDRSRQPFYPASSQSHSGGTRDYPIVHQEMPPASNLPYYPMHHSSNERGTSFNLPRYPTHPVSLTTPTSQTPIFALPSSQLNTPPRFGAAGGADMNAPFKYVAGQFYPPVAAAATPTAQTSTPSSGLFGAQGIERVYAASPNALPSARLPDHLPLPTNGNVDSLTNTASSTPASSMRAPGVRRKHSVTFDVPVDPRLAAQSLISILAQRAPC